MQTVKVKVYEFDELSESAKQKALERFATINVDYDWWEFMFDDFNDKLKEVGIENSPRNENKGTFYFDLDRNRHIEATNLYVFDENKLLKASDCEQFLVSHWLDSDVDTYTKLATNGDAYIDVEIINRETNENDSNGEDKLKEILEDKVTKFVKSLLEDFLSQLQNEYYHAQSEEAIIDTIKANDYKFREEGDLFHE